MTKKYTFCEECRDDVTYRIIEHDMVGEIKGEEYHYLGKEAICDNCGAYVYVPEINDYNLEALYDEYRKANDIIALSEVRAIPKKYAIGKRPLSNLLGWGEHTFTRYYDGDVPTRQYSEILKRIYNDPTYYMAILEENKDMINSERSYKKSKEAVESLISQNANNGDKIDNVIGYILNQCEDITPLALQKSLYYVQGFFFAFFNRFIFNDDCEAWAHGPVYRNIYARYADYKFDPISKVEMFDSSVLTAQEKAVLDSVIKNVCCYSGKILETFTHNESPWLDTRGDIPDGAPSDKVIEKEAISKYFTKIKERYDMDTPADIQNYTRRMFDAI